MITVSIITVNYFSESEILKCIESISEKTSVPFEYIIVSNSDIKNEFIQKVQSVHQDTIIKNAGGNLGFSKACNLGAKVAKGDYLLFLNPDTRFINDVLSELIKGINSFNNAGIAGPKTFNQNSVPEPSAKNDLSFRYFLSLIFPFLFKKDSYRHYLPSNSEEVPVINGHAMFVRRTLFEELGGMEEEFFMYWEENDLCLRMRYLGKRIIFWEPAKLIHISGTSTSPYFQQMEIEKHRSQKKFIHKHYPQFRLLNRISGTLAYSWRATISLITFRPAKFRQFRKLLHWYCFRYK